jgi:diguanylate cyclase (GGDEF)-like protein
VALLYLDLDTLKNVNDALGHDADLLLKEAAHRIGQCIRTSDTAARVGGDEFIVILSKIHSTEDARVIARRIIVSFRNVFYLKDREHSASVSIGISIYPRNGSDPEILMRNADTALYRAKERGGNTFQFYSQD